MSSALTCESGRHPVQIITYYAGRWHQAANWESGEFGMSLFLAVHAWVCIDEYAGPKAQ